MNNVLFIHCLTQELQNNPTLLTESIFLTSADNAKNLIIDLVSQIDPNSYVLTYLHEQIVLGQSTLIEVMASVKEGNVTTLQTIGGWSREMVSNYVPNLSGVYLWDPIIEGAKYVGSSYDLYERTLEHVSRHYAKDLKGMYKWAMENGGLSVWKWGMVYQTPNFILGFIQENPYYALTFAEFALLHHVSQYMPRILEQSLLRQFEFGWNISKSANFNRVRSNDCSPVDVVAYENGEVLSNYPSIKAAAYAVEIKCRNTAVNRMIRKEVLPDTIYGQNVLLKKAKRNKSTPFSTFDISIDA